MCKRSVLNLFMRECFQGMAVNVSCSLSFMEVLDLLKRGFFGMN